MRGTQNPRRPRKNELLTIYSDSFIFPSREFIYWVIIYRKTLISGPWAKVEFFFSPWGKDGFWTLKKKSTLAYGPDIEVLRYDIP